MRRDGPSDIVRDTAVERASGPGAFTARLPASWAYRFSPSGGVLVSMCLRAMLEELGDGELEPLWASAVFCSPVSAERLDIRADVLRTGRSVAQARARLSWEGAQAPGIDVTATFGRRRTPHPSFRPPSPPRLLPPHGSPPLPRRLAYHDDIEAPFLSNFETRAAVGPDGTSDVDWLGRWWKYLVPPRRPDGSTDVLALPPLADTMSPTTLRALVAGRFHAPSLDLTVHFLDAALSDWLLVRVRLRHALADRASAEAEVWTDDGRLVAIASQCMMIRSLPL